MELQLNLKLDNKKEKESIERVKKVVKKVNKPEPTWEEVWVSGYDKKKGIFQSRITDLDKDRLLDVKRAIETGEIGVGVESLRKFSKAHALNLYKQLKEIRRDGIIAEMIANKPSNYFMVNNEDDLKSILYQLENEKVIGLDTETTGVNYDTDYIVGISITLPIADIHCYIPIRHNLSQENEFQLDAELVLVGLKPFLESNSLGKVLHNSVFDVHMFYREGIDLTNIVMDTMIAAHVLNENEPSFALKNLATKYGKYFGFEDKSMTYEELFGKGGFQDTPLDIGTIYACKDTHLCYEYYKWIDSMLEKNPKLHFVYYNIENKVLKASIEMERNGFLIDTDFAKEYLQELNAEIRELELSVHNHFGDINVDSNQQLAEFLYDTKGIEPVNGRSVDKATLKQLADKFEGVAILLEYRQLKKLISTYIEPLPRKVWKRDGRLHGSFKSTGTATGRYSSNNPNLQNLGPKARKLIIAPKGKVMLGIDYKSIEPRVASHISGDSKMKQAYWDNIDLYSSLASNTFKVPLSECGDGSKYRKLAKISLLAVLYGTSPFTLSQQLGVTQDEAVKIIEDFYIAYPELKEFINRTHELADANGYVETIFGRKRRFIGHVKVARQYHSVVSKITKQLGYMPSNIWGEKKLSRELKQAYWEVSKEYGRANRQSVNAIVQGSAADMMKLALISLLDHFKTKGNEYKLLGTIHDEILMEVPEDITEEEITVIENKMINAVQLDVPIGVDTEVMIRWGEGIPLKQWLKEGFKNR